MGEDEDATVATIAKRASSDTRPLIAANKNDTSVRRNKTRKKNTKTKTKKRMKSIGRSLGRSHRRSERESLSALLLSDAPPEEFQAVFLSLDAARQAEAGPPLLLSAAAAGRFEQALLLLAAGVAPSASDAAGDSPLHLLAASPSLSSAPLFASVAALLARRGALPNRAGMMPLHLAARSGNCAVLAAVLAGGGVNGVTVDARSGGGETALHLAVAAGMAEAAEMLVRAGADGSARDGAGRSAHELAQTEEMRTVLGAGEKRERVMVARPSGRVPAEEVGGVWESFRNEFYGDDECLFWHSPEKGHVAVTLRGKGLMVDVEEGEFRRFEEGEEKEGGDGEKVVLEGFEQLFSDDLCDAFLRLEERLEPPKRICVGIEVAAAATVAPLFASQTQIDASYDGWRGFHAQPEHPAFAVSWNGFEFVFHVSNCSKDPVVVRAGTLSGDSDKLPSFSSSSSNVVCLLVSPLDASNCCEFNCYFRATVDGFVPIVPKTPLPPHALLEYLLVNAINATDRAYHSEVNKAHRSKFFRLSTSEFVAANATAFPVALEEDEVGATLAAALDESTTDAARPTRKRFMTGSVPAMQGVLKVTKKSKGKAKKTESFLCVLRKDGLSLSKETEPEERLFFVPFFSIAQIELKQPSVITVILTEAGKTLELACPSEAQATAWLAALKSSRPRQDSHLVTDQQRELHQQQQQQKQIQQQQQQQEEESRNLVLIEGFLCSEGNKKKKKTLFYELRGLELSFFKKKDKSALVGRKDLTGVIPALNKEGCLVLRVGHDATFLLKPSPTGGASNPTPQQWLEAITKMLASEAERVRAEALVDANNPAKIPVFYSAALTALRKRALLTQGIFRLSADKDSVSALCEEWKMAPYSPTSCDFEKTDVHLLACALKKHIREMPVPMLSFALYDEFLNVGKEMSCTKRVILLSIALGKLPAGLGKMVVELMELCNLLHANRASNLMSSRNLAVVFSPSILRSQNETNMSLIQDMDASSNVVSFMAKHFGCCRLAHGAEARWAHAADYNDETNEDTPVIASSSSLSDSSKRRTGFQKGLVSVSSLGLRQNSPLLGRRSQPNMAAVMSKEAALAAAAAASSAEASPSIVDVDAFGDDEEDNVHTNVKETE